MECNLKCSSNSIEIQNDFFVCKFGIKMFQILDLRYFIAKFILKNIFSNFFVPGIFGIKLKKFYLIQYSFILFILHLNSSEFRRNIFIIENIKNSD